MFLLIDNYDSFTHNVVQVLAQAGVLPRVVRNDQAELLDSELYRELEAVVISPGPGGPEKSGHCLRVLQRLDPQTPVLGICLGHQVLGHYAGLALRRADRVMHGKASYIHHLGEGVFQGISRPFSAIRYHSLLLDPPEDEAKVRITAWSEQGEVMGLDYGDRPWMGIQFHPESVLTEEGGRLLENFARMGRQERKRNGAA